jgi:hypothetical protein
MAKLINSTHLIMILLFAEHYDYGKQTSVLKTFARKHQYNILLGRRGMRNGVVI